MNLGLVTAVLTLVIFTTACTSTTTVTNTPTPYPTSTPYPTPTPIPADEAFITALYERIDIDDTVPETGKRAIAALYVRNPTFIFRQNEGIVLQFNILDVPDPIEAKKAAVLLIGTGVIIANQYQVPLDGIEVVYFKDETSPWMAMASTPPWGTEQFFLSPLADEYIERLLQSGVITPTPVPTATPIPSY